VRLWIDCPSGQRGNSRRDDETDAGDLRVTWAVAVVLSVPLCPRRPTSGAVKLRLNGHSGPLKVWWALLARQLEIHRAARPLGVRIPRPPPTPTCSYGSRSVSALAGRTPRRSSRPATFSACSAVVRGHRAPSEGDSSTQELAALVEHGLLDHLVRPEQQRLRNREAERLRGLEIDHQLELRRLLDGEIGGLGALKDLVHVGGGAST
jgi:hypothetical protein